MSVLRTHRPFLLSAWLAGSLVGKARGAPPEPSPPATLGEEGRTDLSEVQAQWEALAADVPGSQAAELSRHLEARIRQNQLTGHRLARWVPSRSIVYPSLDDRGEARTYSGRLYLPTSWLRRDPCPVPLVLYVHGTEPEETELPQFNRGTEAMIGAMAAYWYNFAVAMPDLPGYGLDPSPRPHPYCHAKSLALAVLDLVQPAIRSLESGPHRWDGRLFIMGYSSGGYAALAAVRELQSNPRYQGLALTGSACMAGPFHFSEATRRFLADDSRPFVRPYVQTCLIQAYHDLYPEPGLFLPQRALNAKLLETRAAGLDQGHILEWMNGSLGGPLISQKISLRLGGSPKAALPARATMNPLWLEEHILSAQWPQTPVGRILQENDLLGGWHPTAPMLLATSPCDECAQATNTYDLMADWARRGCTAPIELHPLTLFGQGVDHAQGAALALEKALRWFNSSRFKPVRSRL